MGYSYDDENDAQAEYEGLDTDEATISKVMDMGLKTQNEFEGIIGYESVKEVIRKIVDIMRNPEIYDRLGVTVPKNILFYGPPGVGKTLMANALCKMSGLPVFMYKKSKDDNTIAIRELFEEAALNAPSIVFFDDMDKMENVDPLHTNATKFVFLQECIDEFKNANVFVAATANTLGCLPYSLQRDGRFDRRIYMGAPKGKDAALIIDHYLKSMRLDGEFDLELITRMLSGRSCAALETIINDAGLEAGYKRLDSIDMDIMMNALLKKFHGISLPDKSPEYQTLPGERDNYTDEECREMMEEMYGEDWEPREEPPYYDVYGEPDDDYDDDDDDDDNDEDGPDDEIESIYESDDEGEYVYFELNDDAGYCSEFENTSVEFNSFTGCNPHINRGSGPIMLDLDPDKFEYMDFEDNEKSIPDGWDPVEEAIIHEAGHAVISEVFMPGSVTFMAVNNRGQIRPLGGVTRVNCPKNCSPSYALKANVMTALGGKAAIELLKTHYAEGCVDDIESAYNAVRHYVTRECETDFNLFMPMQNKTTSQFKVAVETACSMKLSQYYRMTQKILKENKAFLEAVIDTLKEKRLVTFRDLKKLREQHKITVPEI